jgi:DNA-binding transcriptional MocR family regulator
LELLLNAENTILVENPTYVGTLVILRTLTENVIGIQSLFDEILFDTKT